MCFYKGFWFIWGLIFWQFPSHFGFWFYIKCNVFLSFTTNTFFSLLRCTVKQPLVCFICLLLFLSHWFSLIAGLFLLSPAMMTPHLAVGTMRNDKMGEPCFYLMGQNQTTVCSQKSVPNPLCHLFLSVLPSTPCGSSLPASHFVCLCVDVFTLCTCFMSCCAWIELKKLLWIHTRTNPLPMRAPDQIFLKGLI